MNDELRAYLLNEREFPDLADLPIRWDGIPADAHLPHSNRRKRDDLVEGYYIWSQSKPWAWEGLQRLKETLLERQEPMPWILEHWAHEADSGQRKCPSRVGRPPEDARDIRIWGVHDALLEEGLARTQAIEDIANTIHKSPETVRSALRKATRLLEASLARPVTKRNRRPIPHWLEQAVPYIAPEHWASDEFQFHLERLTRVPIVRRPSRPFDFGTATRVPRRPPVIPAWVSEGMRPLIPRTQWEDAEFQYHLRMMGLVPFKG